MPWVWAHGHVNVVAGLADTWFIRSGLWRTPGNSCRKRKKDWEGEVCRRRLYHYTRSIYIFQWKSDPGTELLPVAQGDRVNSHQIQQFLLSWLEQQFFVLFSRFLPSFKLQLISWNQSFFLHACNLLLWKELTRVTSYRPFYFFIWLILVTCYIGLYWVCFLFSV